VSTILSVRPLLALRGVLQPLTELQVSRSRQLRTALELVAPERADVREQDARLGVAAGLADCAPAERVDEV
jgi:hypothetical protein